MKELLLDLIINSVLSGFWIPCKIRRFFLNVLGMNIGIESAIHGGYYISGLDIEIGEKSYINRNCIIDAKDASIKIGNCVGIAYDCKLITSNHNYKNPKKRTGRIIAQSITIGDGVWIGTSCIILPGVNIESGVVVAAGSVVKDNCEKNYLYAGIPAKKIKKLSEEIYDKSISNRS